VRLLKANEADGDISTVVEADVVVVCDAAKLDARGCRGGPDLVIEVLLPATAAHDQAIQLAAFERHGIKECWFVHPTDRILSVDSLGGRRLWTPGHTRT
jgi:Uma2 family endonuclease